MIIQMHHMTIFAESHYLKEEERELDDNSARLINRLLQLNATIEPKIDIEKVKQAIYYIKKYHAHQQRHSGEPYYYHPLEVAMLTADYFHDTDTIIAALLHDIVEDTKFSLFQVEMLFGRAVASLVDCLSNLDSQMQRISLSKEESLHKLMQLQPEDKRVLTVKLLDRLHNMRTLSHIKSIDKQKRIALATLQTFIPLAKYLGIKEIEIELRKIVTATLNN